MLNLDPMTIPRIVRVGTIAPLADNAMKLELAGYPSIRAGQDYLFRVLHPTNVTTF